MLILLLLPLFSSSPHQLHTSNAIANAQPWIKSGYWHSRAEFPVPDINSALYTHLICAFARLQPSGHLSISPSDEEYFSTFTQVVKRKNPEVVTLLSIWTGPRNTSTFPPLIAPPDHRKNLIDSSIKTARAYGFQGLDLHCVQPSMDWNMTHLGVLLDEWRAAVDSESDEPTNSTSQRPRLILTMAVYYSPTISASLTYPIDSILRNVDWLHLTSYDYHVPTRDNFTQFHAALYDPPSKLSTDAGVEEWMRLGLPASKLLLGLPFHGYAWKLKKANGSINLGAPAGGPAITNDGSVSYDYIKTFIQSYRVKIAYDARSVENYCTIGSFWISFDDVEAIRAKVSYAKEKKLLGYSVWEVSHDENWALSRAAQDEDIDPRGKRGLLLTTLIPSLVVVLILAIICCLRRLYKSRGIQKDTESTYTPGTNFLALEHHTNNDPDLQAFKFDTIKTATENFLLENKLGQGGFGPVYRFCQGKLPTGQEIAVKRLSKSSMQGTKEFKNEVSLTAKLQHVNLVRLLGFCTDNKEKLLIYEYLPNKSLDFYLFDPERRLLLNWEILVGIIEGVTQGLLYLQEYSRLTIIHRDLKAGNILLDSEMKPKISDLGMAKIFENSGEVIKTNQIVGTYGYIPPECVKKNAYSMKSDVFSFGVLLLQILSGKKNASVYGIDGNINLLQYAYEMWKEGMGMGFMDPSLDDTHSYCKMIRCMHVALLCVQEQPTDRPSMLQVSGMLKNETTPSVTPKRPAFSLKESGSSKTGYALQKEIRSTNDPPSVGVLSRRWKAQQRRLVATRQAQRVPPAHTISNRSHQSEEQAGVVEPTGASSPAGEGRHATEAR